MKRYIRCAVKNISDESEHSRWRIAEDPRTRPETLREIANNLSNRSPWGAYIAVTANPNTPTDVLEMLARRWANDPQMLMNIVRSPNVTSELLQWIYDRGPTDGVLACLACNPKTPVNILRELSHSDDSYILAHCAANPNTPGREKLQHKLYMSDDKFVRKDLASSSVDTELLASLATDSSPIVRRAVAGHLASSVDILAKLVSDQDDGVREILVQHPNITPELLVKLSEDSSSNVRKRVTWSKKTPVEVLEKLAEDPDEEVRRDAQEGLNELHYGYQP